MNEFWFAIASLIFSKLHPKRNQASISKEKSRSQALSLIKYGLQETYILSNLDQGSRLDILLSILKPGPHF